MKCFKFLKKKNFNCKVIVATGGTGGHLFPAQKLGSFLLKKGCEIIFLGKNLSSNKNFEKEKYDYKEISSSYLRKNIFLFFFHILKGFFQSLFYIKNADIVVGFGSYYSFPILISAYVLRKKIVLFEPNVTLGKVNKIFANRADLLALQFYVGEKRYKNEKKVLLWPWEEEKIFNKKKALEKLGLKKDLFTILVFAGSQWSDFIDEKFLKAAQKLKDNKNFQVIHLTSNKNVKRFYEKENFSYFTSCHVKDMDVLYQATDLCISRSGACTMLELIFYEIPSFLIPFERGKDKHQEKNALFLEKKIKGALIFSQKNFDNEKFLKSLLNKKKILEMKYNLSNFKKRIKKENRKRFEDYILKIGGF